MFFDMESFLEPRLEQFGYASSDDSVELKGCCPFCKDYKTRFFVNTDKEIGFCHNCAESYTYEEIVSELENIDPKHARNYIEQQSEETAAETSKISAEVMAVYSKDKDAVKRRIVTMGDLKEVGMPSFATRIGTNAHPRWKDSDIVQQAQRYLQSRGVDLKTMSEMNMHAILFNEKKYMGRIAIPVMLDGKIYSWLFRAPDGNTHPKEIRERGSQLSRLLYNIDTARTKKKCVVVEGVFDALRVGNFAVASFGKKLSKSQIDLLAESDFEEVILCYDPDARKDMVKAGRKLMDRTDFKSKLKLCFLMDEDGDPGSMQRSRLYSRIRNSRYWDDFQWVGKNILPSNWRS